MLKINKDILFNVIFIEYIFIYLSFFHSIKNRIIIITFSNTVTYLKSHSIIDLLL